MIISSFIEKFADMEQEFIGRAHQVVWCNVATVDTRGRVRSRILHPIWEGPVGWVVTRRHSHKAKHLAQNPYVSLAYIADIAKPVYVDCLAEWADDPPTKQHVWDFFKAAPPPLGHDPGTIFQSVDDPGYGVLKLNPWRIELAELPSKRLIWRRKEAPEETEVPELVIAASAG